MMVVNSLSDDLQIKLKDGSGTLEVTPVSVKQDFKDTTFSLVYTAATEIRDADDNSLVTTHLRIVVPDTLDLDSSVSVVSGVPNPNITPSVVNNVITWEGLSIESGKTFKTVITKVNPVADTEPQSLTWRWTTEYR